VFETLCAWVRSQAPPANRVLICSRFGVCATHDAAGFGSIAMRDQFDSIHPAPTDQAQWWF
jgi:hypothetical protein